MGNVSLVIVSHSRKLAEGVVQLTTQLAGPSVHIAACGGIGDDLGTSAPEIVRMLEECPNDWPILLLLDLGSALFNCEMALELSDESIRNRTDIVDAPLVEGAVAAAVAASLGKSVQEVKQSAEEARGMAKLLK